MNVDANKPRHIAVIMDGNGRWAKLRNLPRIAGHRKGVDAVKNLLPICARRGVEYLTLFAFSSENWRRPPTEINVLFDLFASTLESQGAELERRGIRLRVIGEREKLPARLRKKIHETELMTRNNRQLNLTIALNYGGRWDMAQAARAIALMVERGEVRADTVTPELIESKLCTRDLPPPDLLIRTGGEFRVSNFLLWQLAYAELVFIDAHWPDFGEAEFDRALAEFAGRQRRFGKTDEQTDNAAEDAA